MNSIYEKRSVIQTQRTYKGQPSWFDGIGGNDIEAAKRALNDLRRMYPKERYRLVQIVVEDTENP